MQQDDCPYYRATMERVIRLVPSQSADEMRLCDLDEEQIKILLQLRHLSRQGVEYIEQQMSIAEVMFRRGVCAAGMAA